MSRAFLVDWGKLFTPSEPILETIVRGTILYLAVVLLMRFVLKREKGQLGTTDLLVLVLLGDASQNAMAGQYTSITDGVILILTLVLWSSALNWFAFRFSFFDHLLNSPPLPVISNGRMLRYNMKRELITETELTSQMRLQGVSDVSEVEKAYVEPDGRISVITKQGVEDARGAPDRDSA
jgi:uncharacterized membrane protein YcaP (DUF421 family)